MVKCDNCFESAAYTCADPGVNPVNYCSNCLPVWLQERANLGHFPLVEPIAETTTEPEETPEPVKTTSKKKKKAASSNEDNN